jgi:hypothetical protein
MVESVLSSYKDWAIRDFSIKTTDYVSLNLLNLRPELTGSKHDWARLYFTSYKVFRIKNFIRASEKYDVIKDATESRNLLFCYKLKLHDGGVIYIESEEVQIIKY